jgi:hypothetical protein
MKINEAAESSGCHLESICSYERIGLMAATRRTASGDRDFRDTLGEPQSSNCANSRRVTATTVCITWVPGA